MLEQYLSSGFVVLQTVFLLALGWFIRLLIIFSRDMKTIEARVTELEKSQAVDKDRWTSLEKRLDRFEQKIDKLINSKK
jgi:TolA-binding protein